MASQNASSNIDNNNCNNSDQVGTAGIAAPGMVPAPASEEHDDILITGDGGITALDEAQRTPLKPSSPGYEALWTGGASLEDEETNLWADPRTGPRQPGVDKLPPVSEAEKADWEREQRRAIDQLRDLCEDAEYEHDADACPLRPEKRVWARFGPPDRPELGRYPETLRWAECHDIFQQEHGE